MKRPRCVAQGTITNASVFAQERLEYSLGALGPE